MALATALPPAPTAGSTVAQAAQPATRVRVAPARTAPTSGRRPSRLPDRRPKLGPVGTSHRFPGAAPMPVPVPVRLTRRGVLASWVVAVISIAIAVFGLVQGLQPSAPAVVGSQSVVVQPGQSLWEVAQAVNPSVDPRVTLAAIRSQNTLDTSVLVPGSTVTVPTFDRG
jgi:hypothetical protein